MQNFGQNYSLKNNFMVQKQAEETKLLKQVIQSLCTKLGEYQKQFISNNKSLLASEQAHVDSIVNKALEMVPGADGDDEVFVDDGFA